MTNKINVAAYCRVSTDSEDQLNSLSAQITHFTKYINQQEGWKLKEVYYDEGLSGVSVKKRESFNRMISDADNGEIDLILTKEVSRFARNTVDTLTYTRRLSAKNVGVIFTNDNIDTRDKDGELRLSIMASVAQDESRKTSERVKWGIRRKMEQGYVLSHAKMLGLRNEKGVLRIVPEETDLVKRIFHEYLYNKKGTHTIARELNEEGLLSITGSLWRSDTIMRTLKNDKYVGDLTQLNVYVADYLTKKRRVNKGEVQKVHFSNHHEAIISREVWDAVQQQIAERAALICEGRKHSSTYWFSGKVKCGECEKSYIISGGKKQESRGVRCINRQNNGTTKRVINGFTFGCDNPGINQIVLNESMRFLLEHINVARESIINDLLLEIERMQRIELAEPISTKKLEKEVENLNRKKTEAIDLMLEGIITKDDLKKQAALYDSEIARLNEEIYNSINADNFHKRQIDGIKACIAEVNKTADIDSDNIELYGELVQKIIVHADCTVDFYLNCVPFGFKLEYSTQQGNGKRRFSCEVKSLSAID